MKLSSSIIFLILQAKLGVVVFVGILQDHIYAKLNKVELTQMPGRIAIVTGGSRGMGLEVVKMLLQCDMEVIMACRNTTKGEKAVQGIREESGIKTGKVRVMELNNASFDSIKRFVVEFQKNYEKLDVLVNNAGVALYVYKETKDGFEEQYGVNHLSHFLLTLLLIPQLKNAGTAGHRARVINVSSIAYVLGDINFEDVNYKKNFDMGRTYPQSKLAVLLAAKKFARLFNETSLPISVHAVHPGVVNTKIWDDSIFGYLKFITSTVFKTKKEGATSITYAAVSPSIEGQSGLYISNCLEWSVTPFANNETLQDRFFEFSLKQVGIQHVVL